MVALVLRNLNKKSKIFCLVAQRKKSMIFFSALLYAILKEKPIENWKNWKQEITIQPDNRGGLAFCVPHQVVRGVPLMRVPGRKTGF